MVHTYHVSGMTCGNCETKIKSSLQAVDNVTSVSVSKEENTATIEMEKHIPLDVLQQALPDKYRISTSNYNEYNAQTKNWLATYKPIMLIFTYITVISFLIQFTNEQLDIMQWMRHFMAGFFLVFSFFKLLNLKGFADSYMMYDIVAKHMPIWGYFYAFIELGLGIAFLINFNPLITNSITFVIMSISVIGVLQSVLNKRKIQCACLGAIFDLPMSTITIIEDVLMIAMSGLMLLNLF